MIAANRKLIDSGGDDGLKALAVQSDLASIQSKDESQSIF